MWKGAWLCALAIELVSCGGPKTGNRPAGTGARTYQVRGVVREIQPDGRTVLIRHEEIPGYMEAMSMAFNVRETNELAGLKPGDEVSFRLSVTGEASWIDRLKRTGRVSGVGNIGDNLEPPPPPAAATNLPAEFRLSQIPDFALTNEFGQPVSLRQFRGKAVALTFFFTRCPIPEYCPRLTKNFQGAIQKLKATPDGPTNFHFLSISFDPVDTPILLRSYANQYRYDSNHWSFLTGHPEQIRELARGFGVPVSGTGATLSHGFSTTIFDADGRLRKMWPIGGDMTDTIVAEILQAAKTPGG
jgi:protein SCO1/2